MNLKIIELPISYKGRSVQEGKKIGIYDGFRALYVLLKYNLFNNSVYFFVIFKYIISAW